MALLTGRGTLVRELADSKTEQFSRYELALPEMITIPTSDGLALPAVLTRLSYAVIAPLNTNRLAVHQGVGHRPMGPGQHPGHGWPGNLQPLGHLFLGHFQEVGQAHGLQLVHRDHYLLQGPQGNAPRLKKSHSRLGFHPPALFGSAHFFTSPVMFYF
jgi:hypothetical protein